MCNDIANSVTADELGPLQIDYVHFYFCQMEGFEFFSIIILFLWVVFLISLLGNTATNYFSSTLASICGKLNLSYDIAGVTFLAFGNGAPDVFSSIASLTGGANALIGIGSILGGSVFVTTIVVGSVAIICPCEISGLSFTRDIIFYLIVASMLALITMTGKVSFLISTSLFVIYIFYAIAVLASSYYKNNLEKQARDAAANQIVVPQVQTAYWYRSSNESSATRLASSNTSKMKVKDSSSKSSLSEPEPYRFLILDDNINPIRDDEDEDEDTTVINLSGGLISAEFNAMIIEDYFDLYRGKHGMASSALQQSSRPQSISPQCPSPQVPIQSQSQAQSQVLTPGKPKPPGRSLRSRIEAFSIGEDAFGSRSDVEAGLTASLLSDSDATSSVADSPSLDGDASMGDGATSRKGRVGSSMYWQQLLLRRRLQRSFMSADWWTYPWYLKALAVIEFPAVFARDITIPTIDEGMWYKPYAVVQPVAAFMFLLIVTGQFDDTVGGNFPVWVIFLLTGISLSIGVYFTTHHSYPPKGFLFSTFWVLFSFSMCIGWIYTLAGELVCCLTSLGKIFDIPPIFLGLTVLAWGNSIGDLFANVAVAKRGLGPMALAGCYGGPVFDILVGMGFALTIACSTTYPEPFEIAFDRSSLVSLVFLFTSLLSTLLVVTVRGYVLEAWFGYFLIGLYCLHTFVQAMFLISRS